MDNIFTLWAMGIWNYLQSTLKLATILLKMSAVILIARYQNYSYGGCSWTQYLPDIPIKIMTGAEIMRMWWTRPFVDKISGEMIRGTIITKMLIKGTQNCIRCKRSGLILVEGCFFWLNTSALRNGRKSSRIPDNDQNHRIDEENWTSKRSGWHCRVVFWRS
jgi:hypothetical protein